MKIIHLLIIVSGIVLLGLLVYSIGPQALWRELSLLGWGLVMLMLIEGVSNLFHARGWKHCLSESHRRLSFSKLFCAQVAGGSINYLTPTAGLGGEVAKGLLIASNRTGHQAASSVILDKLSYALAQLVLIAGGCFMLYPHLTLPRTLWFALVPVTGILGGGIIGFLIVQRCGKLGSIVRWAALHRLGGAMLMKTAGSMTQVDEELRLFYRTRPWDLVLSVTWHFAGLLWGIIPTLYFFTLVRGSASLAAASAVTVLGNWFDLVAFAIPADIGIQEATRMVAFRILGFQAALGLTYAITRRMQQMFWAALGLILYGLLISSRIRSCPLGGEEKEGG